MGEIPGLERGKRIAIPLNTTVEPVGTLRVILRDGRIEVHYAVEVKETVDCGTATLGVDKGYTEVLVDSDGDHHGEGLGERLKSESDTRKLKNQRRTKLRAIARNTGNERKRRNIIAHNLGRKKVNRQARKAEANIRDIAFKAVHAVVNKAAVIAAEDLISI